MTTGINIKIEKETISFELTTYMGSISLYDLTDGKVIDGYVSDKKLYISTIDKSVHYFSEQLIEKIKKELKRQKQIK